MPPPPRDPRTTLNLELPVPGDEDPPDHVTYHGELADAVDSTLFVPVIEPPQLSDITSPYEGQMVDMAVYGLLWRLRYTEAWVDSCRWVYVGGMPLVAVFSATSDPFSAGTVTNLPPTLLLPRDGFYQIGIECTVRAGSALSYFRAYPVFLNGSAVPTEAATSGPDVNSLLVAASTWQRFTSLALTGLVTAQQIDTGYNPSAAGVAIQGGVMSLLPRRIR